MSDQPATPTDGEAAPDFSGSPPDARFLVVPWLAALIYLIARADGIQVRDRRQAEAARDAMAWLVSESPNARPRSAAGQLSTLAELRSAGDLTDAEFQQQKDKVLAQGADDG